MTAIDEKWGQIPWIGAPVDVGAGSQEGPNPDGRGSSRDFEGGSIYWTPNTGAHEVHGDIRDLWPRMGWECSFLRYPVSDEMGHRTTATTGSKAGTQSAVRMAGAPTA
ncbi:hypothetical protein [Streptomyces canus]|uniref:hypothetical protein n=1 Tax=Streptomyces canus TaxID=58343 RepID=UPI00099EAF94|nr:hypothetical protein [Streptomyces canus]